MVFTFLYVTCSDVKEANNISRTLLSKKLIACANFFPVDSMYWWKNKVVDEKETVLILKTMKNKTAMVRKEIEKLHSYKIPCITEINVKPNGGYGKWMERQCQ